MDSSDTWSPQKARNYVKNNPGYQAHASLSSTITAPICVPLYAPRGGRYRAFQCSFKYVLESVQSLGCTRDTFLLTPINAWRARIGKIREEEC